MGQIGGRASTDSRKTSEASNATIAVDRADELRGIGFKVRPRDNYQAKAGWLTGLFVPHDTDKCEEVVALALEAIRGATPDRGS